MIGLFLLSAVLVFSRFPYIRKSNNLYEYFFSIFAGIFLMEWVSGAISSILLIFHLLFLSIAYYYVVWQKKESLLLRMAMIALALILGLGLMGHWDMMLVKNMKVSQHAPFFSLNVNKNIAFIGAILVVFLSEPVRALSEIKKIFLAILPIFLATAALLFLLACWLKFVRVDLKIPPYAIQFLIVNFLFICVAEEAFFRFLIQDGVVCALGNNKARHVYAICISAFLFGLVHAAGGSTYVLLSCLAGFGYAYSYFKMPCVEAPILLHFLINMTHFFCFTYPYLER